MLNVFSVSRQSWLEVELLCILLEAGKDALAGRPIKLTCGKELFVKTLVKKMRSFFRGEDGPTVTEYAVMLALIILICMGAILVIGNKVKTIFTNIDGGLPSGS